MVPYLIPQECGNALDVRRLSIAGRDGGCLTFTGLPTVEANVLPYARKRWKMRCIRRICFLPIRRLCASTGDRPVWAETIPGA